jgi:hypothetical protein
MVVFMMTWSKKLFITLTSTLVASALVAAPLTASQQTSVDQLIKSYQAQGASTPSITAGAEFWQTKGDNGIACTACHGQDLTQPGKHIKTKRAIEPMAPSVNLERLSDASKVEKWFKRNCKSVWNRECTATEKANVLAWLATQ